MGLIFHCETSLWAIDLPVASFAFHSSLLTAKIINLVVAHNGFLKIVCIFDTGYFDYTVTFQMIRTAW